MEVAAPGLSARLVRARGRTRARGRCGSNVELPAAFENGSLGEIWSKPQSPIRKKYSLGLLRRDCGKPRGADLRRGSGCRRCASARCLVNLTDAADRACQDYQE